MMPSKKTVFGIFLLLLMVGVAAFGIGLLYTEKGRDFVLAQLQHQLPETAQLNWQRVDGVLAGSLRFRNLVYSDGDQRYEAGYLAIDAALLPLLRRQLNIAQLHAERVRLHFPKDDTPFEFPRWPESLPTLDLPLQIRVNALSVTDMQLFQEQRLWYMVSDVRGAFTVAPGALLIARLQAESEHGRIDVRGDYWPSRAYATRLEGTIRLKSEAAGAAPALHMRAEGNAKRFLFDIEGALPEPVRVRWALGSRGEQPFWMLSVSGERFEPAMLGLVDTHAYRMQLAASGDARSSQVAGELGRDGNTLIIEPSRIALDGNRVLLQAVHLRYGEAQLLAQGSLNTGGELYSDGLLVRLTNYPLPLPDSGKAQVVPVRLNADVEVSGKISAWQMKAHGTLLRAQTRADFDVDGHGSDSALELQKMKVVMAQGGLDGRLHLRWQPAMAITFDGTLRGFDPAYFFAAYPGAIDADLHIAVTQSANRPWQGAVKIDGLGGQLRGRRLAGKADLRFNGMAISGAADLRAGASHVTLQGRSNGRLDVTAGLQPLDLNDVSPAWSGQVRGVLMLQGSRVRPDYRVDLQGSALHVADTRVEHITLRGSSLGNQHTQLEARELQVYGQHITQLALQLDGPLAGATYHVSAQAGAHALDSSGQVHWQHDNTRLRPQTLRLDGGTLGIWQLQDPAMITWDAAGYRFTPLCFTSPQHGARLCAEDTGSLMTVKGDDFPLALLEPWINNTSQEFTYAGVATLHAELPKDFTRFDSGFVDMQVPLLKVGVKSSDGNEVMRIEALQLNLKWLANRLSARVDAQLPHGGKINGALDTGFSPNAPLQGRLELQVNDLSWLELFSLDLAQPSGRISGEIELSGRRDAPRINGAYRLQDFNVQIPSLGLKLADGQITARSTDNFAMLVKGSIKSGDGRLSVIGVWDPVGQLPQPIDLRLIGKNVTLADIPGMQLRADTDLLLGYAEGVYRLDGDVNLLGGQLNLESLSTSVSISNDVVVVDPLPERAQRELLRLGLRLKVGVSDQVKIRGYGLDGAVSGKVVVNSPADNPTRLTGVLRMSGVYAAYGKELTIKRGNLQYTNGLVFEPRLDILTERVIKEENITVGLQISGPATQPRTVVVSNPAMSDSDALSWLLFGRPLSSVSAGQADSINAKSMALNAGGSLLVGTLGRKVGLDSASISDSRALGDSTLTIGKQISPRLFVSYGVSLLGIGQVITLKYLLRAGLDISIESEQSERREQTSAALNWRK